MHQTAEVGSTRCEASPRTYLLVKVPACGATTELGSFEGEDTDLAAADSGEAINVTNPATGET
ncbi:MAG TPA: hypothetical protein PLG99_11010, partial [Kaistiaceae bacterium]|nr:hypothetical protein [Kaistiaceae bacterium]